MKKFTYVEWIAVVVALGIVAIIFGPTVMSYFGSSKTVAPVILKEGIGGINTGNSNNESSEKQMTNISTLKEMEIYEIQKGDGAEAKNGNKITVHYVGSFRDGTVFDTSLKNNVPFTFTLGAGQVIQGWDLGFSGMKVGDVRRFVIAPELAYGALGAGPIPPNSTLVFEVELLKVE